MFPSLSIKVPLDDMMPGNWEKLYVVGVIVIPNMVGENISSDAALFGKVAELLLLRSGVTGGVLAGNWGRLAFTPTGMGKSESFGENLKHK